ncbi:1-acyl-sn-glycerol-3-phosphate acyltransferase [Mycena venus]|uniref:1-acyl-sn-glycerol-3-phosphate acyltransferase n=1 Tax=Mycena venus TaxID=2733690 RepID=A0A8H6WXB3_9AGAR|nr:1-acyl-sn-glycerol-3-phosphate acyltransferase [Mycena venus]
MAIPYQGCRRPRPHPHYSSLFLRLPFIMGALIYVRYCLRTGFYLVTLAFWGIASTPLSCAFAVLGRRFEAGSLVTRLFSRFVGWALDLRVEFDGAEHLTTQPAVFMLNHQSALDIWLLGRFDPLSLLRPACPIFTRDPLNRSFPKRVSVMAKKSLGWSPLGPVLYLSGCILVERGTGGRSVASMRKAGTTLREAGVSLVVFPEGTRNGARTPTLLPFRKGGFHMAVQSGMPIVPIVCENYSHMYRFGYFEPVPLKARVLPPIPTAGLGVEDVPALTIKVQQQMLEAVRDISRPARARFPTLSTRLGTSVSLDIKCWQEVLLNSTSIAGHLIEKVRDKS